MKFHSKQNPNRNFGFFTTPYVCNPNLQILLGLNVVEFRLSWGSDNNFQPWVACTVPCFFGPGCLARLSALGLYKRPTYYILQYSLYTSEEDKRQK